MKILFHKGNIHFQDFGGKNFVIPNNSEGEIVLVTLQEVLASKQNAHRMGFWEHVRYFFGKSLHK